MLQFGCEVGGAGGGGVVVEGGDGSRGVWNGWEWRRRRRPRQLHRGVER